MASQTAFGPADPHSKNVLELAYNFVIKTWRPDRSRDFVTALVGVPASRERILRFVEEPSMGVLPAICESVRTVLREAKTITGTLGGGEGPSIVLPGVGLPVGLGTGNRRDRRRLRKLSRSKN